MNFCFFTWIRIINFFTWVMLDFSSNSFFVELTSFVLFNKIILIVQAVFFILIFILNSIFSQILWCCFDYSWISKSIRISPLYTRLIRSFIRTFNEYLLLLQTLFDWTLIIKRRYSIIFHQKLMLWIVTPFYCLRLFILFNRHVLLINL